jgi:hypothetical protein
MFRLIQEVIFCGLIAIPAVIVLVLVDLGSAFSIFTTSFFKWILLICRVVVVLSPWEIRFRFGA